MEIYRYESYLFKKKYLLTSNIAHLQCDWMRERLFEPWMCALSSCVRFIYSIISFLLVLKLQSDDFDEFSTDEFDINLIPFQIKFIHLSIMIWYNFFNSRSECIMPYDFS